MTIIASDSLSVKLLRPQDLLFISPLDEIVLAHLVVLSENLLCMLPDSISRTFF